MEKNNAVDDSPVKKNPNGKFVSYLQKQRIINLYKSKMAKRLTLPVERHLKYKELIKLMSEEIGIGQRTISKTLSEYQKKGTVSSPNKKKVKGKLSDKVSDFEKNTIRKIIHGFWHRKQLPTFEKILVSINNNPILPNFARTSLQLLLKDLNFEYTKINRNNILTERGDIVCHRQKYLESIRYYRNLGRPIYYLDETWINLEATPLSRVDTTVQSEQKNSSTNVKRLIIVHIGSSNGFVVGGYKAFEPKINSNNYRDEMNGAIFYEWFSGILPLLEENSVIVMDNALYHSVKKDTFPLISWKKDKIIKWLESRGKIIDRPMVKHRLLEDAEQFRSVSVKEEIDELARENNKIVLRLPLHHCELNPMELAWKAVKQHVKKTLKNPTFNLSDIQKLLLEGVKQVTPQMWKNFISKVVEIEDEFLSIDFIADSLLEAEFNASHILTITGDISDSSS